MNNKPCTHSLPTAKELIEKYGLQPLPESEHRRNVRLFFSTVCICQTKT